MLEASDRKHADTQRMLEEHRRLLVLAAGAKTPAEGHDNQSGRGGAAETKPVVGNRTGRGLLSSDDANGHRSTTVSSAQVVTPLLCAASIETWALSVNGTNLINYLNFNFEDMQRMLLLLVGSISKVPTLAPTPSPTTLAPTPSPTQVPTWKPWEVSDVSGASSVERSCCLCNFWVRVKITPRQGGTRFRLGIQGSYSNYLLNYMTIGISTDSAIISSGAPAPTSRTGISVGGSSGATQISFTAYTRTYTDWITFPISGGTSYVIEFFHVCGPDYYARWATPSPYTWISSSQASGYSAYNYVYDIDTMEVV